jgi:HAD superfamily phosphoserine phosphatase-like hydrolase
MTMKALPTEKMDQIKKEVRAALKAGASPVAAFDADGTLWKMDMGENFFQYKIDHKLVSLPADPWAHYEMLKKRSNPEAYLWLAQILEGKTLEQTREWAQKSVDTYPGGVPVFPWMKEIISFLKAEGIEVYIVTASIKWAVEPAAKLAGVAFENVLGIETEVVGGLVTTKQKGLITYREGKPAALIERTQGQKPVFAAGNTMGDFALLESASHVRFVNVSDQPTEHNYPTEQEVLGFAKSRGWHWHQA